MNGKHSRNRRMAHSIAKMAITPSPPAARFPLSFPAVPGPHRPRSASPSVVKSRLTGWFFVKNERSRGPGGM
ncbi:unnamed protein product, partial [Nesidiocoris tenuis]